MPLGATKLLTEVRETPKNEYRYVKRFWFDAMFIAITLQLYNVSVKTMMKESVVCLSIWEASSGSRQQHRHSLKGSHNWSSIPGLQVIDIVVFKCTRKYQHVAFNFFLWCKTENNSKLPESRSVKGHNLLEALEARRPRSRAAVMTFLMIVSGLA